MTEKNWLEVLHEACLASSQAAVARRLGVSATLVNQALKGTYSGNLERLQTLVEGTLMNQMRECPAVGDMPKQKCLEHQARPRSMAFVNPYFSKLYRACRSGCPHSKLPKEY